MPPRAVIHVDMDAFYASVEQRDRPELRGRPVVVGDPPRSRSVVCAASYEARRFGVRSAMASAEAWRRCPHAVFVPPDFARYGAESRRIHEILARHAATVEPVSLDEAYLDVDGAEDPAAVAAAIRAEIRATCRLSASAGVAPNKFLAKAASDAAKPDGLRVVAQHEAAAFAAALPIGAVPGVGPVTAARMRALGIERAGDLLRRDADELRLRFGSATDWFLACARGEDERAVEGGHERAQISCEETFDRDLADPRELHERIAALAEELARRLRAEGLRGHALTLKVRYADFVRSTRSRTLHAPIDDAERLCALGIELLAATEAPRRPVRLLGLSLGRLEPAGAEQQLIAFGGAGEHESLGRI